MSTAHDVTVQNHATGSGASVRIRRALRGTDFTGWSGTAGYKQGLDLLMNLHCDDCCGTQDHENCSTELLPTLRLSFLGDNKAFWFEQARAMTRAHQMSAHEGEISDLLDDLAGSCPCHEIQVRKPPHWEPLPHPHSRICQECSSFFEQPGCSNEVLCPECKMILVERLIDEGFVF